MVSGPQSSMSSATDIFNKAGSFYVAPTPTPQPQSSMIYGSSGSKEEFRKAFDTPAFGISQPTQKTSSGSQQTSSRFTSATKIFETPVYDTKPKSSIETMGKVSGTSSAGVTSLWRAGIIPSVVAQSQSISGSGIAPITTTYKGEKYITPGTVANVEYNAPSSFARGYAGAAPEKLYMPSDYKSEYIGQTSGFGGSEYTARDKTDKDFGYLLGYSTRKVVTPVGRFFSSLAPSQESGRSLQSSKMSNVIPTLAGSVGSIALMSEGGLVSGAKKARTAYTAGKSAIFNEIRALSTKGSTADKVFSALEWTPKTGKPIIDKGYIFGKGLATYIPETYAVTKATIPTTLQATAGKYAKDDNLLRLRAEAEQTTLSQQLRIGGKEGRGGIPIGGFAESIPGVNILYGTAANTNTQFKDNLYNILLREGYGPSESKKISDAFTRARNPMKVAEFGANILPSANIEGTGRDLINYDFKRLSGVVMDPATALKKAKWIGATNIATLGLVEGVGEDYISQVSQSGGTFTGTRPVSFKNLFTTPTNTPEQLDITESIGVYNDIKASGKKGMSVTAKDQLGNDVPVTQYTMTKGDKQYYVFVDANKNIVGGEKYNYEDPRRFDPTRSIVAGGTGLFSAGLIQRGIMSRQVKDIPLTYGPNGPKYGPEEYFTRAPIKNVGEIEFGTSTIKSTTSDIPSWSPSDVAQKKAYILDWTEKPGDITQDWFRNIRRKAGRTVEEPVFRYGNDIIDVKSKVRTLTTPTTSASISPSSMPTPSSASDSNTFIQNFISPTTTTQISPTILPIVNAKPKTFPSVNPEVNPQVNPSVNPLVNPTVNANVNTLLRGSFWMPGAGIGRGEGLMGAIGGGRATRGVNVNYLRNLFFDPTHLPSGKNVMVSGAPRTFKMSESGMDQNINKILGRDVSKNRRIAANSSPFKKMMKRIA